MECALTGVAAVMLDAEVRDHVLAMPESRFAVVDGALVDNLPARLSAASLETMSLFREHPNSEAEREGPWLVALPHETALNALARLALRADYPWGVFWCCPLAMNAFARHLRSLNLVLLPNPQTGVHESAMFRHWDPTALALVTDVLDPEQIEEVLGPAQRLVMPREGGGALVIDRSALAGGAARG